MDIGTEYMVEHGHDAYGRQNRLIGKPHANNRLSSVFEALPPLSGFDKSRIPSAARLGTNPPPIRQPSVRKRHI